MYTAFKRKCMPFASTRFADLSPPSQLTGSTSWHTFFASLTSTLVYIPSPWIIKHNTSTPPYHRELLIAWNKYSPLCTRYLDPVPLSALLQESIFCNPLITLDNTPLRLPHWISAGITRVQDICYLAIPGFLPPLAIHELLYTTLDAEPHLLSRTIREFQQILPALPPPWKSLILRDTAPVNRTATLQFTITRPSSPTPPNIERHSTRAFYLDLLQYPHYNSGLTLCFLNRFSIPLSGKISTLPTPQINTVT